MAKECVLEISSLMPQSYPQWVLFLEYRSMVYEPKTFFQLVASLLIANKLQLIFFCLMFQNKKNNFFFSTLFDMILKKMKRKLYKVSK